MPLRPLSVYVHFPYCLKKCPYCDFVSYKAEREAIDHRGYADAVLAELERRAEALGVAREQRVLTSVFFGGGTPSLWEPDELGRVLAGIRRTFTGAPDLEITVECNPTSLDADRAARLRDVGVNRLSLGVQSLKADELAYLGRLHDGDGALAAVEGAVASGVRVSADIIFGLPDQTRDEPLRHVDALLARGLRHLSCYQLTIEPGTRFGELARKGRLPLAEDGAVAEAFLALDDHLAQRGLEHYEISNYAAPGEASRHNLGYWRGHEYLGLGCGAYGFVRSDDGAHVRAADGGSERGAGLRYRNEVDPARYVEATPRARAVLGEGDGLSVSAEALDGEALLRERIMLGLRLASGFDLEAAAEDLGVPAWNGERRRAADRLVALGRLHVSGGRLTIPRRAWLFADDVAARLF